MRAERSRGSHIRSQSSRNRLIKKICLKSPAAPGFFFLYLLDRPPASANPCAIPLCSCRDAASRTRSAFKTATASAFGNRKLAMTLIAATRGRLLKLQSRLCGAFSNVLQGYPVSTSKKKRVCVVTYRHSGDWLFENSIPLSSNVNNL